MKDNNLPKDSQGVALQSFVCSKDNVNLSGIHNVGLEDITILAVGADASVVITWADNTTDTVVITKDVALSFASVKTIDITGLVHLMR